MSIGERIIELRTLCNMTQGELARAMEVSRQAVSKWENDQAVPDALKMIRLAEVLESDIEYISTGRRTYGRRPPVVIKTVETVETVVEKTVVQVVEKIVEKVVEKPVIQYVDRPVTKKVYRTQYRRNPIEFFGIGIVCFIAGLLIGILI